MRHLTSTLARLSLAALIGVSLTFPLHAAPVVHPGDLNPGDPYRLVFVSSATTTAVSNNHGDYNNFVNGLANGVAALAALGTEFRAIVSTPTLHAIDNTFTNSLDPIPIYRLDGQRVWNGYGDLWGGAALLSTVTIDETGTPIVDTGNNRVWSGTYNTGLSMNDIDDALGALDLSAGVGAPFHVNSNWIQRNESIALGTELPVYALSGVLTTVPLPPAAALLGLPLMALVRSRRRRSDIPVVVPRGV